MNGPSKSSEPIEIPKQTTNNNELPEDGMTSEKKNRTRVLGRQPSQKLMEEDIIGKAKFTKLRDQISTLFKKGYSAPEENTKVEEAELKIENKI